MEPEAKQLYKNSGGEKQREKETGREKIPLPIKTGIVNIFFPTKQNPN